MLTLQHFQFLQYLDKDFSGIYSDNIVKIDIGNVNDVVPEFQNINQNGKIDIYVKENSPVSTEVSGILAIDGDGNTVSQSSLKVVIDKATCPAR